jgi:hypothetical protein
VSRRAVRALLEETHAEDAAINFPLIPSHQDEHFKAIGSGDTQPYSNDEVGYVRDTLVRDVIADGTDKIEFLIVEGDILGDHLGLYPRLEESMQAANVPICWVPGNHDLDADAPSDAHSFDTFRREWVLHITRSTSVACFVVLDDVRYPSTSADNADGLHAFCEDTDPAYTGALIGEHRVAPERSAPSVCQRSFVARSSSVVAPRARAPSLPLTSRCSAGSRGRARRAHVPLAPAS